MTKINGKLIVLFITLLIGNAAFGQSISQGNFSANNSYQVCFTPGSDCTGLIVKNIEQARKTILVQAYSFTSDPIARALVQAKNRGVQVKVILDKSNLRGKYSVATYFKNNGIPVWIDYRPAIAHSKIIILDDHVVETGSFNFTKAAQYKNAENLLIIDDANLAKIYTKNWYSRLAVSKNIINAPFLKSKS